MSDHAYLSPSGSPRWMACPGAPAAESTRPDKVSKYAAEGTAAHELGEVSLKTGLPPGDFVGEALPDSGWVPDADMAAHVARYVRYVGKLRGATMIEETLDLSAWTDPEGFGTPDAVAVTRGRLTLVDLKYGVGVKVWAEDNTQLMIYALGALDAYAWISQPKTVRLVIHQPRLEHVDEWDVSVKDLRAWGEGVLLPARDRAMTPGAARVPGEAQCRWCRAKGDCPAQRDAAEAVVMTMLGGDPPVPASLTDDELSRALTWRKTVEAWFKGVEGIVAERAAVGGFPGWKMVSGRGSRSWSEGVEDDLAKLLGDKAWVERKLVTPAAAEKMVGKSSRFLLDPLVVKKTGKPTLAPEGDKRPAVSMSADDFEAL